MRYLALVAVLSALCARPACAAGIEIRPTVTLVLQAQEPAPVLLIACNTANAPARETLSLSLPGGTVQPDSVSLEVAPKGWQLVAARVSLPEAADTGVLTARAGSATVRLPVMRGIDLTLLPWKRKLTDRNAPVDPQWASPDVDDRAWPDLQPPGLWEENDYAWCRVHVTLPEAWRGRRLRLLIGAVDDNDVTYLNGEEIGRTNGWDIRRDYPLPERLVRWGADNVLTVMVDNPNYGGGLYKGPLFIVVGDRPPQPPELGGSQHTQAPPGSGGVGEPSAPVRPKPGKIGAPLPLRRMHVAQGVLRYPEGTEVALWGVNIYPQSWHQFENMTRLKLDMKAVIREDLDHLQLMGVEAIRIHVFDREISDGKGNLVPNVHLDLLDYLVAECSRRGIYMFFTPIAWWGGPNEVKGAFSAETSKPGMMFVPDAKAAAANYLKQFLTHKNRYSGRAYKDEPCLCVLEVMNEPAYFLYGDVHGSIYSPQGERPDVLERDHRLLGEAWRTWLARHGLHDSPVYFAAFRYEQMRTYIQEMIGAIRATGAQQPVAIASFGINGEELTQAIADSECDAITLGAYPGGWQQVNDGINLLPSMGPTPVDPRLAGKARLVYEFDTPATNTSCYLFPAIAASFRAAEVQIACQFQYDSVSTARWNTDWGAHWLNWLYTPAKTASFMIGRETFHRLPRGVRYTAGTESLKLGPMAASFAHNQSLLVAPDLVIHARSLTDWKPLPLPRAPKRIVGTGSSPYVEYAGTGLYVLEPAGTGTLRLRVNPDARLVGNSLRGSLATPVAELEEHAHLFRLKLPGWERAECRPTGAKAAPLPRVRGGWLLRPGVYTITRLAR